MAYSGAEVAKQARETLGQALGALQETPSIPAEVMNIAQNMAQAIGALFEAEKASSEPDGKSAVKAALGIIGQTLALLQDARAEVPAIDKATESIALSMSMLFPLTQVASRLPEARVPSQPAQSVHTPRTASQPAPAKVASQPAPAFTAPADGYSVRKSNPPPRPAFSGKREKLEVNIGATTESNFFVGFSGEISEGGVFAATYNIHPKGTYVEALVTLPGGFEKFVNGFVRFVRDPMDMHAESEPGMGIQFESIDAEARELILRFVRKRAPMFYDE